MMNLHDYLNVRRVFRTMANEWGCPVWMVRKIMQQSIDRSWAQAAADPEWKGLWNRFFPAGKPTPSQYILWLGHAYERGEDVPCLLRD